MRELSLFSGAGGGLLGSKLLGWKCYGYVEFNDYCQRVIRQRIDDGILDNAPIFGDIRTFISDGYARRYRGMVDVVTAGFPCQPFSTAGKQLGADDPRNMWPSTIECIRQIRPRYAFLENVPALLSSGYFGTILADLAESGYDCRWRVLSSAELGASHRRDRVWIVAHSMQERWPRVLRGRAKRNKKSHHRKESKASSSLDAIFNTISQLEKRMGEPSVSRANDGLAHRVDRLEAIGNGQDPRVFARAWEELSNDY